MRIPASLQFLIDSILLLDACYNGDWKNALSLAHATATALVSAAPIDADLGHLERAVLCIRNSVEAFITSVQVAQASRMNAQLILFYS
jgi:hypothetical protein